MKSVHKHLAAVGLLAALGFSAFAQTPAAGTGAPQTRHERMAQRDPAKMQERMAQRQAELKAKLQITASQEGAWNTFTNAIKPPADRPARMDRAEFAKLTTPERIDRMQAMKAQRDARMAQHAEATKAFYAVLTPEQQKTFDAETLRLGQRMHRHHGGHPRG
jgi:Spy/CpxP family protein refolding chaperone